MLKDKILEKIKRKFEEVNSDFPEGVGAELRKTVRSHFLSLLSQLDLVTREEFDVQAKVLLKTRSQLDALSERVLELEEKLMSSTQSKDN